MIVIVNSVFLQRPQKRSRRNQLIHRRLPKTKSTGSKSDPESQASRQSDGYGGFGVETGSAVGRRGQMQWNNTREFSLKLISITHTADHSFDSLLSSYELRIVYRI